MQLVGDGIAMWDPMKNKPIGRDEVIERFGVGPELVRDCLALTGDSSDNVPGVPGIGVKTAATAAAGVWLARRACWPISTRSSSRSAAKSLEQNAEKARLSYQLVGLQRRCALAAWASTSCGARTPPDPRPCCLPAAERLPLAGQRASAISRPMAEAQRVEAQAPSTNGGRADSA